jgi:hypothetical protein
MNLTQKDLIVLAALAVVRRAADRLADPPPRALAGPPSAESARAVLIEELVLLMKRIRA